MLKLNFHFSLIPSARHVKLSCSYGSCLVQDHRAQKPSSRLFVKALRDETDGDRSSSPGWSWEPGLEIEVPFEQRPVNEYSSLKNGVLYSWGELEPGPFFLRVGGLWLLTFTILGVPIAAASFDPTREPLRFVLAAGTGTLFLVSLILLRIYLGWSYVGDRLLSAVVPYEESGWHDGQMWVKPPEVLARDRLLGSYKVKPVINGEFLQKYPRHRREPNKCPGFKNKHKVQHKKRRVASTASGGGQYCKWEDLLK
ncbi:hypothetical protein SLA2020_410130 [Shorea laevis]